MYLFRWGRIFVGVLLILGAASCDSGGDDDDGGASNDDDATDDDAIDDDSDDDVLDDDADDDTTTDDDTSPDDDTITDDDTTPDDDTADDDTADDDTADDDTADDDITLEPEMVEEGTMYYGPVGVIDLVIDSADVLHASYQSSNCNNKCCGQSQYYATNPGGSWSTTMLSEGGCNIFGDITSYARYGAPNAIVLDNDGDLWLAYHFNFHDIMDTYHECIGQVLYSIDVASPQTLTEDAFQGRDYCYQNHTGDRTSLAIDSLDVARFSYSKYLGSDADFAVTYQTLGDEAETLEICPRGSVDASALGVDGAGRAHVIYDCATTKHNDNLRYATNETGVWLIETIDASPAGEDWDIVRIRAVTKPGGEIHAAYVYGYYDGENYVEGALKYAHRVGGVWTVEEIDSADGLRPASVSLALDGDGYVYLAYHKTVTDLPQLHVATNRGGWHVDDLGFPTRERCDGAAAVFDAAGQLHIMFFNGEDWYDSRPCNLYHLTVPPQWFEG